MLLFYLTAVKFSFLSKYCSIEISWIKTHLRAIINKFIEYLTIFLSCVVGFDWLKIYRKIILRKWNIRYESSTKKENKHFCYSIPTGINKFCILPRFICFYFLSPIEFSMELGYQNHNQHCGWIYPMYWIKQLFHIAIIITILINGIFVYYHIFCSKEEYLLHQYIYRDCNAHIYLN